MAKVMHSAENRTVQLSPRRIFDVSTLYCWVTSEVCNADGRLRAVRGDYVGAGTGKLLSLVIEKLERRVGRSSSEWFRGVKKFRAVRSVGMQVMCRVFTMWVWGKKHADCSLGLPAMAFEDGCAEK